jgi:hypothetical protein
MGLTARTVITLMMMSTERVQWKLDTYGSEEVILAHTDRYRQYDKNARNVTIHQ